MTTNTRSDAVADLIAFLDASPTPYHAVAEVARRLDAAGYRALDERDPWTVSPGDRRYLIRAGGTLVAFVVGNEPAPEAGFFMVGAHTDSPNFRVKPLPDVSSAGHRQIGVETYGGVLLSTWLDRDLALAGRVTMLDGTSRMLRIDEPLCRISNLAIHLNPKVNTDGPKLNAQQHLVPTIGLVKEGAASLTGLLAERIDDVQADAIAGLDLCLYDTQGAAIGGAEGELLFSARIDNLASCHAAITALLGAEPRTDTTRVVALYDHEEIGSQSASGARSRFLAGVLERLARAAGDSGPDAIQRALARSLLVSADMAHAVHPNYADKHDAEHQPRIGNGPVIKINANQSYATDAPSAAVFESACREAGFSAQRFVSRNDMRCGSTIGPISAAQLGVRTVDVGNPMLSMHSCRETTGTADVDKMIRVLTLLLSSTPVPDSAS